MGGTMSFKKAVRTAKRAKIALDGPSGSGKTATALRLARGLAGPDGKVAVIDTERGSASLYAGRFGGEWDVDDDLPDFSPKALMDRMRAAEAAGYAALVVDSFSHFWMGTGGELEMVDAVKKRSKSGDGFGAWREVTPIHNELIQCILTSKLHIVCCMRTKTEWLVEQNERGKNAPRRIGTTPIQRDGTEFEFDVWGSMDGAALVVVKTRLEVVPLGLVLKEPGEEFGGRIATWLSGAPAAPEPSPKPGTSPPRIFYAQLVQACAEASQPEAVWKDWLKGNGITRQADVTDNHLRLFKMKLEELRAPPTTGDGPSAGREPEDDSPEPGGAG